MRLMGQITQTRSVQLIVLLLFAAQAWAQSGVALPAQPSTPASDTLARRAEAEGTECSPEGQWNCMPDTWQRCASGVWSVEMDLAEGTKCTPEGLTEEFSIEHDGTVNGGNGGGNDGGDSFSGGPRGAAAAYVALTITIAWVPWVGLFW